jgi:hypothetical protein
MKSGTTGTTVIMMVLMEKPRMTNELSLKWGTIKGCSYDPNTPTGKKFLELVEEFDKEPSGMMHSNSERQREILYELIDLTEDPEGIYLDWDGKYVSKEEAKKYIREYGR